MAAETTRQSGEQVHRPLESSIQGDDRPALFDVEREEPLLGSDPSVFDTEPTGQVAPVRDRPPELASFAFVRRGYDPAEVDAVLLRQRQEMARAVERATTSERQLAEALIRLRKANEQLKEYQITGQAGPPPSIEALGERVTRILREAWDGAEALRAEAEKAAERANAEAQRIAGEAEAEARQRASVIIAQAKEERRAVLAELAARRSEHEAELARLEEQQRAVMAHMQQVHGLLQRALAGGTPGALGEGADARMDGASGSERGGPGPARAEDTTSGFGERAGRAGPAEAPPGSAWGATPANGGLVQSPPGSAWSGLTDRSAARGVMPGVTRDAMPGAARPSEGAWGANGGAAAEAAMPGANGAAVSYRVPTSPEREPGNERG